MYLVDGDRIVLIASKAGAAKHPAWLHNLSANPRVSFLAPRGRSGDYVAREAEGPERERLWDEAVDYYAGYADYQRRAGARQDPRGGAGAAPAIEARSPTRTNVPRPGHLAALDRGGGRRPPGASPSSDSSQATHVHERSHRRRGQQVRPRA